MSGAVSTAALMDSIYGRQRFIYDLTRKHYLLGRDDLIAALRPPAGGTVLEIGCGTARNLIAAHRRYPDCRLHGIDISTSMLETAAGSIRRAGIDSEIALAAADAACFDPVRLFGTAAFDRVFASYTLSMIPAWQAAIGQAARLVAPGGRFLVVDFGDQERLPRWFRAALRGWLHRFHVEPRRDLQPVLAEVAARHDATLEFRSLRRGYAVAAQIDFPDAR